jgi:hypothetical protein
MTQMDDELRRALRRVNPPAGFADRVVRAAETQPGSPKPAPPSQPSAASARHAIARWAIAATLVAAIGGGVWYRAEERRNEQGEEAKRQVLLSLSIAGGKLRSIEMKVNHEEGR